MPPPPPSASYNLVIDTDSSSDDTDETPPPDEKGVSQQKSNIEPPTSSSSSPTKKKKHKKKRKKKKSSSNGKLSELTSMQQQQKSVRFNSVSVREYERGLGCDVVPVDGGWPLGMSSTVRDEYSIAGGIDEFEERRQTELRQRWLDVMSEHMTKNSIDSNTDDHGTACIEEAVTTLKLPTGVFETRQFDYRKTPCEITGSTRNPLFRPLSEDERMRLLVSESPDNDSVQLSPDTSPRSPSLNNTSLKQRRRMRSNSEQFSANDSPRQNRPTRRSRSNSDQYYSGTFTTTEVLHARNELEQVRVQRSMECSTGCACRKLDVYIPPKNGGGKKAQHRRMNERKVKEELRRRGILPDKSQNTTRSELEQLLHDAVDKEPCCWNDDCVCFRNGLGCQADACSCWHDSHQRKGHSSDSEWPSIPTMKERCGNHMYVVDLDGIGAFRKQFCTPIAAKGKERKVIAQQD